MKLINGYWTDENNNIWDSDYYTKEQALKASGSLTRCMDCTGCTDCTDCTGCTGCMGCTGCTDCTGCTGCTGCTDCTGCTGCMGCTRCMGCMDCTGCTDCMGCTRCMGFNENPNRYGFKQYGGKYNNTCAYWIPGGDVQVVCGCFTGSLDEFETAVLKKYDKNHGYMNAIKIVKTIMGMEVKNGF